MISTSKLVLGVSLCLVAACSLEPCPTGQSRDADGECRHHPIDDAMSTDPYTGGAFGTQPGDGRDTASVSDSDADA